MGNLGRMARMVRMVAASTKIFILFLALEGQFGMTTGQMTPTGQTTPKHWTRMGMTKSLSLDSEKDSDISSTSSHGSVIPAWNKFFGFEEKFNTGDDPNAKAWTEQGLVWPTFP